MKRNLLIVVCLLGVVTSLSGMDPVQRFKKHYKIQSFTSEKLEELFLVLYYQHMEASLDDTSTDVENKKKQYLNLEVKLLGALVEHPNEAQSLIVNYAYQYAQQNYYDLDIAYWFDESVYDRYSVQDFARFSDVEKDLGALKKYNLYKMMKKFEDEYGRNYSKLCMLHLEGLNISETFKDDGFKKELAEKQKKIEAIAFGNIFFNWQQAHHDPRE